MVAAVGYRFILGSRKFVWDIGGFRGSGIRCHWSNIRWLWWGPVVIRHYVDIRGIWRGPDIIRHCGDGQVTCIVTIIWRPISPSRQWEKVRRHFQTVRTSHTVRSGPELTTDELADVAPLILNGTHKVAGSGMCLGSRAITLENGLLCCCITPQLLFSLCLGWWPSESGTSEIVAAAAGDRTFWQFSQRRDLKSN